MMPVEGGVLTGHQEPRLCSGLLDGPSHVESIVAFAELLGEELMPWQRLVLEDATRHLPDGKLRRRQVGLLLPRQQGKTFTARLRILWGMFVLGEDWVGMAQNRRLALDQLNAAAELAKMVPDLAGRIVKHRQSNGDEALVVKAETGRLASWRIAAATQEGPRGLTGNLWIDELREISPAAFAAATPVTRVVPNSQIWVTSNAGDNQTTVLNDFRQRALVNKSEALAWYEWSADPQLPIMDELAWQQSNPALGYRMDREAIELAAMNESYEAFMTETLCRWVDSISSPWPPGSLDNAASDAVLDPSAVTYFGLDKTPDSKRVDLVAAQVLDGRITIARVQSWTNEVNPVKIADEVAGILSRATVGGLMFDVYAGGAIGSILKQAGRPAEELTATKFAQACEETLGHLVAGTLTICQDDDLLRHLAACVRKPIADGGWRVVRRGTDSYISAACAAIIAIHQASKPLQSPDIVVL